MVEVIFQSLWREALMSKPFLLTERQMARIAPYFSLAHSAPQVDDRRVVSGIIAVIIRSRPRNGILKWAERAECWSIGGNNGSLPFRAARGDRGRPPRGVATIRRISPRGGPDPARQVAETARLEV